MTPAERMEQQRERYIRTLREQCSGATGELSEDAWYFIKDAFRQGWVFRGLEERNESP